MNCRRVGDYVREVRVELGLPLLFVFFSMVLKTRRKEKRKNNRLKIKMEEIPGCAVECEHIWLTDCKM